MSKECRIKIFKEISNWWGIYHHDKSETSVYGGATSTNLNSKDFDVNFIFEDDQIRIILDGPYTRDLLLTKQKNNAYYNKFHVIWKKFERENKINSVLNI